MSCQPKPQPASAYHGSPAHSQRCEDGLEIHTMRPGKGPKAGYGDQAQVHYIASVHQGATLSSSHDRNPNYVPVGRKGALVEGLHRGLVGMRVGELRKIVVPKDLGYRGRKVPGVPVDATLEFLVEMFAISKSDHPQSAASRENCPS